MPRDNRCALPGIKFRKTYAHTSFELRACLHGGGGPQVGEVTRLAVVENWPAFTCKLTTPGSRGDVTRPYIFRSFDLFCRFTLVYEGHFVLCYKEKTRAVRSS